MKSISIKAEKTNHEDIMKFLLSDPLPLKDDESLEFGNDDDTSQYPFANALFRFPFILKLFISSRFVAVKKADGIDWDIIKDDLVDTIQTLLIKGVTIKKEGPSVATIYVESTPNPESMKFVCNRPLVATQHEFFREEDLSNSPLAEVLCTCFDSINGIFMKENYITITKNDDFQWEDIQFEIRDFLQDYLNKQKNKIVINDSDIQKNSAQPISDPIAQQIVEVLAEYIEPAVSSDGGNIEYKSYDSTTGEVKVTLKGSCSGCPSSTLTLKNAIEETLKNIIGSDKIVSVVAD